MTAYGTVLTAGYRGDGLRGWKQTASGRTYFLYDGIVPVCEMNSSGSVTATNVFGGDGLVGRSGAANIYYVFDQQGNVAQRLNSSQGVTSSSTYDAYGAEASTGTPSDPFGYNAKWGYYFDREAGVYKCTFRDYDPSTGRWLTRDAADYPGGINLYGYCGDGPNLGADLLGFQKRLIVHGNLDGVPFGSLADWLVMPGPDEDDIELGPDATRENVIAAMGCACEFYFFGHGSNNGSFELQNGQTILPEDIYKVSKKRQKHGVPKMKVAWVRSCYSGRCANYVNTWLQLTNEFHGYPGLTGEATWTRCAIYPIQAWTKRVTQDPGASFDSGMKKKRKKG
jgi:RHS repeat-associated protein